MSDALVIVGAGIFGLTAARVAAEKYGMEVLILEKRGHMGGNAFSSFDSETGIEVHEYGAHIFHTNNEEVWKFATRFDRFTNYTHRVKTSHWDRVYSMPINLGTMCEVAHMRMSPHEARAWVKLQSAEITGEPQNLEEKAISLVGRPLYEAMIKGYTMKQWETDPKDLPPEIITRLPIRFNYDDRYFNDKYQGLPEQGYSNWLWQMAQHPKIKIEYNIDFLSEADHIIGNVPIIYTGPLDRYFGYAYGPLGWRTLDFQTSTLNVDDYQGCSVMNEADQSVQHTRTIEWKHFYPERDYDPDRTIITREYSRTACEADEPYYPINSISDRERLERYRVQAKIEQLNNHVFFGGRLGTYQYLDMHMAMASAMRLVDNKISQIGQ